MAVTTSSCQATLGEDGREPAEGAPSRPEPLFCPSTVALQLFASCGLGRRQARGQYALDSFPEENHNPFSDHNDFINVNSDRQMKRIAACINAGRHCS